MSWKTEFYAALTANTTFNNGVTALFNQYKSDAVAPYAKYQLIAGNDTQSLEGSSTEGYYLIQLSVWANTPTESELHALSAIQGAKDALNVSIVFNRSGIYDDEEELFSHLVDFTIWFDNP